MPDAGRLFYRRYHLLTALLPACCMACMFYGSALLLYSARQWSGGAVYFAGGFAALGLSPILSYLGFVFSGVPAARLAPDSAQAAQLAALLGTGSTNPLPMMPHLVELGAVPFLAVGGLRLDQLWISSFTLRRFPERVLRCMLTHEAAHVVLGSRRPGCAWYDLSWVLAFPLALLGQPLTLLAAAVLHTMLWLRLQRWLTARAETAADRWAAEQCGGTEYVRALAEYLLAFEAPGATRLRQQRLGALGLTAAEINGLLDSVGRGSP